MRGGDGRPKNIDTKSRKLIRKKAKWSISNRSSLELQKKIMLSWKSKLEILKIPATYSKMTRLEIVKRWRFGQVSQHALYVHYFFHTSPTYYVWSIRRVEMSALQLYIRICNYCSFALSVVNSFFPTHKTWLADIF